MRVIRILGPLMLLAACSGGGNPPDGTTSDTSDTQTLTTSDTADTLTTTDTGDTAATTTATGCLAGPVELDLGTGVVAYEPLAELADITIVHGPQGGWHIDTAALVSHTHREVSILSTITVPSMGDLLIAGDAAAVRQALVNYEEDTCTGSFYGVRAVLFGDASDQTFVCSLEGVPVDMTIEVSDLTSGKSSTETLQLTAQLDENDVANCAM